MKWKKRTWTILISIVLLLVIIRLILPYVILHYANKSLKSMDGYYGNIADIDLSLFRGAYQIDHLYLDKVDTVTKKHNDFFEFRRADLSIEWRSLLNGRIVGKIILLEPQMHFTKDKVEPGDVRADSMDFRRVLDDFMPLKINRFEVRNGTVHYLDHGSRPPVNIHMQNVQATALNLSSVVDSAILPSSLNATAEIYRGRLNFNMKMNPLARENTFDMNAELNNTHLPDLNEFFQAYAKVDVNKGTFGLYTEIAAKEGKFAGYVKPVIRELDVYGHEDREDNFLRKMWEAAAGTAGDLLKNQKEDQIATKIPLKGDFKETDTDTWYAIIDLLRNAFISALQPSLDHQINIASVDEIAAEENKKGFLKKVFSKEEEVPQEKSRKEKRQERREERKKEKQMETQ